MACRQRQPQSFLSEDFLLAEDAPWSQGSRNILSNSFNSSDESRDQDVSLARVLSGSRTALAVRIARWQTLPQLAGRLFAMVTVFEFFQVYKFLLFPKQALA